MKDSDFLRQHPGKFCFIDLETYNLCLSFDVNSVWQTSMFVTKYNDILNKQDILTKWDNGLKIGEEAARITRFREHNNRWGTTMEKALKEHGEDQKQTFLKIKKTLDKVDFIVAHNGMGFDFHLIKEWYRINGEDFSDNIPKLLDTNCLAKSVLGDVKYHKERDDLFTFQMKIYHKRMKGIRTSLSALGKKWEIEHDYNTLHDAYSDLELNFKVWQKLKWLINV